MIEDTALAAKLKGRLAGAVDSGEFNVSEAWANALKYFTIAVGIEKNLKDRPEKKYCCDHARIEAGVPVKGIYKAGDIINICGDCLKRVRHGITPQPGEVWERSTWIHRGRVPDTETSRCFIKDEGMISWQAIHYSDECYVTRNMIHGQDGWKRIFPEVKG